MGQLTIDHSSNMQISNDIVKENYAHVDYNGRTYVCLPNNPDHIKECERLGFKSNVPNNEKMHNYLNVNKFSKAYLPNGWTAKEYVSESEHHHEIAIYDEKEYRQMEIFYNDETQFLEFKIFYESEDPHFKGKNTLNQKPQGFY